MLTSICVRGLERISPTFAQDNNPREVWQGGRLYHEDIEREDEDADEDDDDDPEAMETLSPTLLKAAIALHDMNIFAKAAENVHEKSEDNISIMIAALEQFFTVPAQSQAEVHRWLDAAWPLGNVEDELLPLYKSMKEASGIPAERTQSWFDSKLDEMVAIGMLAAFAKGAIVIHRDKLIRLHITDAMLKSPYYGFDERALDFLSAVWGLHRAKMLSIEETRRLFEATIQRLAPHESGKLQKNFPNWPISGRLGLVACGKSFAKLIIRLSELKLDDPLENLLACMLEAYRGCSRRDKLSSIQPVLNTFSKSYTDQQIDARLRDFLCSLVTTCREDYIGTPPPLTSKLWRRVVRCKLPDCDDCPKLNKFLGDVDQRKFEVLLNKERHHR